MALLLAWLKSREKPGAWTLQVQERSCVMAGLDPAIHVFSALEENKDGRIKPGYDVRSAEDQRKMVP